MLECEVSSAGCTGTDTNSVGSIPADYESNGVLNATNKELREMKNMLSAQMDSGKHYVSVDPGELT